MSALHENQSQSRHRSQSDGGPSSHDDLFVRHGGTGVPDQMSDTVPAVVGERERQEGFDQDLGEDGPGRKAGGDGGALEVPAEQRGDEVGGSVGVDGDGEGGACDAVQQ